MSKPEPGYTVRIEPLPCATLIPDLRCSICVPEVYTDPASKTYFVSCDPAQHAAYYDAFARFPQ